MKNILTNRGYNTLLCILFILLRTYPLNSLRWDGNILYDLEGTGSSFIAQANQWGASSLVDSNVKTFDCVGTITLGGYNVLGGTTNQYFERTFTSLPNHNQIRFYMTFYAFDSWDLSHDDHFEVKIGDIQVVGWTLSGFAGYATLVCGNPTYTDIPAIRTYIVVPHTGTSVTVRVINMCNEPSENESLGFRDISLTFENVPSPSQAFCGVSTGTPLPGDVCPCFAINQYMNPPNSGNCFYCDANCATCSGASTQCTSCYDGKYLSGTQCVTCHGECNTCTGGSNTQCTSCKPARPYWVNSNSCYPDCNSPLLIGSSGGKTTCYTPCSGQVAFWDRACSATCPLPRQPLTYNTFSTCTFPCATSSNYLYWNGTCSAVCDVPPFERQVENSRNFCKYPCGATQYLFWNGTCSDWCDVPFARRTTSDGKKYCDYPCSSTQFLYWNGTCDASCNFPLAQRTTIDTKKYCDFPCFDNQYLYWDQTCSTTCPLPRTSIQQGSPMIRNFCTYTCGLSQHLFWNGTCSDTCDVPPFARQVENSRNFCKYPCGATQYLFWNGTCSDWCDIPYARRTTSDGKRYCDYPCSTTQFLYWNGTCDGFCKFPLAQRTLDTKQYCDFPCPDNQYLFWDQTCSTTCPLPRTSVQQGSPMVRNFCTYTCGLSQHLFWNGTCSDTCDIPPFERQVENSRNFCKYPCGATQYLFWNGTCSDWCDVPFVRRTTSDGKKYCDYPCTSTQFLYWNGTCDASCNLPLAQRTTIDTKKYCDFPCADNQYLYWDQTCSTTCPLPRTSVQQGSPMVRNFCTYTCGLSQHLFWNGTCSDTCDIPPFRRQIYNNRNFCEYPCTGSQRLYWNGSCIDSCAFPLAPRTTSDTKAYCDFPCSNSEYLYWNGSCIPTCAIPFVIRIDAGDKYCDYPCLSTQVLYWDGMCSSSCPSPLSLVVEGSSIQKNFCKYTCQVSEFLYWNKTCSSECPFPLANRAQNSRMFCEYPCDSASEYLYWNGSCLNSCPFPLSSIQEGGLSYCHYSCAPSEYLYWNGSCMQTCDSPLSHRIAESKKYCDHLCDPDFLYLDGSCSSQCLPPRIQKIEGNPMIRKFCTTECKEDEYLYWNGTCSIKCEVPLIPRAETDLLFCDYSCTTNDYLYWNGSCLPSCPFPLSTRREADLNYCDYPCGVSEFLYWNGSCISFCEAPLMKRDQSNTHYCDFPCGSSDYLYKNGTCSSSCSTPFTPKIEGSLMTRKFCAFNCKSNEFLSWNGSCLRQCPLPYIITTSNTQKFCNLPCENSTNYYYEDLGTCQEECLPPYSIMNEEPYLQCYPPDAMESGGSFFSMFMKAPVRSGTFTVVTLVKVMQYVRYLDIEMPPRLQRLGISKGRNILSINFGFKMPEEMRAKVVKEALPFVFQKHDLHSSFLVNYWEILTSIFIGLFAAFVLFSFEKMAKKLQWESMETVFARLRVIAKWNFVLMLIAINIDDILLLAALELKTSELSSKASLLQHVSFILSLTFIGVAVAFIAGVYLLIRNFQKTKMSVLPYNSKETLDNFHLRWESTQILYRGFRDNNIFNQMFFLLYLLRLALPMFIVTVAYTTPLLVSLWQVLISILTLAYIILMKPFKKRVNHIQLVIFEAIVLFMNICLLILTIYHISETPSGKFGVILGDMVIIGNDCLNLMVLAFLVIKCAIEASVIATRLRSKPVKTKKDKTAWLQLLALFFQQGSMGFEEMIEDAPVQNKLTKRDFAKLNEKDTQKSSRTLAGEKVGLSRNQASFNTITDNGLTGFDDRSEFDKSSSSAIRLNKRKARGLTSTIDLN